MTIRSPSTRRPPHDGIAKPMRFRGPVWPIVAPDYDESLDNFKESFLRGECGRSQGVREYLEHADRQRPKALEQRLVDVERTLERLGEIQAAVKTMVPRMGELEKRLAEHELAERELRRDIDRRGGHGGLGTVPLGDAGD